MPHYKTLSKLNEKTKATGSDVQDRDSIWSYNLALLSLLTFKIRKWNNIQIL